MHSGESLAGAASAGVAPDREPRILGLALLASLVLHALLLVLLPMLKEAHPSRFVPPPLKAHLAEPKPPPEPPRVEPPPVPSPSRAAAKAPRAAPAPESPAAPTIAVEPAKQQAEAAPAAPPQPAPQAAARSEPQPPAAAGPDPGSMARFRLELMEIAQRYKRYPRIAQDNNWEGRVELRVAFAENGAMSAVTVKKSAGRSVLDEEAQAMIRSAQGQAVVPPALRGRAFTLEIPVNFSLQDAR